MRSFKSLRVANLSRSLRPVGCSSVTAVRFNSSKIPSEPKETYTQISDTTDPQRKAFFQYSWGSWMKNDALERKKRETKFSIEGITKFLKDSNGITVSDQLELPKMLEDGTNVLMQNLSILGEGDRTIRSIASIHEGKHNRIYKITLANSKELVLRIPYYLEQAYTTSIVVKSEVATLDFLNLKLGLNVPKVIAYGFDRENMVKSPFILMEYISGDLLMKKWDPLVNDEEAQTKLNQVIDPIMEFYTKSLEISFNRYGSLYFANDVTPDQQKIAAYDGETDENLINRWKIGPTTERIYHKGKFKMNKNSLLEHLGPFDTPTEVLSSVASVQLEHLRHRVGLAEADAGETVNKEQLNKQIQAFENYSKLAPLLLNSESPAISNVQQVFKPKLFFPDLDPLNVILNKEKGPMFVDFENTSIKPFILSSYPAFVAYSGAKIYNLEEDIPDYANLDDVEKQQYQFMYFKTRNERLWEVAFNKKRHDLISIASPHIKVLKSPYLQVLDIKTDKDYLYVNNALIQLQQMWEAYVVNGLANTTDTKFPFEITEFDFKIHEQDLEAYQNELISTPFAATGGWVPQDMFENLKEQGMIVKDKDGNYKIETVKVLEQTEEEEAQAKEAIEQAVLKGKEAQENK